MIRNRPTTNLRQGLVGAWSPVVQNRLIGATGYILPDLSGRGNHGTLTNMEQQDWTTSQGYSGLDFGGTNERVVCNTGSPVTTSLLTVCAWLTPQVTTRGDIVTCWRNGTLGGATENQFNLLYGLTSGKPQIYLSDGSSLPTSGVGATVMAVGTRYFLCGRYDKANVSIWVNGVQEASAATTITLGSGSAQAIRIGDNSVGDGSPGPLTGIVHEALLYDRPLSPAEIMLLHMLGPGGWATTVRRSIGKRLGAAPPAQNNAAWWLAYQMGM